MSRMVLDKARGHRGASLPAVLGTAGLMFHLANASAVTVGFPDAQLSEFFSIVPVCDTSVTRIVSSISDMIPKAFRESTTSNSAGLLAVGTEVMSCQPGLRSSEPFSASSQ